MNYKYTYDENAKDRCEHQRDVINGPNNEGPLPLTVAVFILKKFTKQGNVAYFFILDTLQKNCPDNVHVL